MADHQDIEGPAPRTRRRRWPALLLLIPLVGTLIPPVYDRLDPGIGGMPFFYWYQLAWVAVSAVITVVVYRLTGDRS